MQELWIEADKEITWEYVKKSELLEKIQKDYKNRKEEKIKEKLKEYKEILMRI